ncbi:MAG: hypothetical protein RL414_270 [Actinomycetota bacterium]
MKRFIYNFLLVTQIGIVVTGGAVRLTGSGLGCPTWPECTPGSYTPVPHQAQGVLHSWIEFGNRLLTFLLFIAILASIIGYLRWGRQRSDSRRLGFLALTQFLGIVAQIVVGGISVLTHLNPFAVGAHFILSIVLIAATVSFRERMLDTQRVRVSHYVALLSRILLLLSFVVITLGIFVTGSGPHAGDEMAKRFNLDPRTISWLHADSVIALVSLTIGTYILMKAIENGQAREVALPALGTFLIVIFAQGAIGYTQYFTGLPEILVGAHLLGACLVWASIWRYAYTTMLLERVRQTK